MGLQPLRGGDEILGHLRAIDLAEQLAALVVVARITADRRQRVRRKGDEVLQREPPRDVLGMRIETAILVDDENRGQFCGRFAPGRLAERPDEIAADLPIAIG